MKNLLINRALAAKKKKIFTLLLTVAASIGTMFAGKVKIGDLYYNLDASSQTAEVTSQNSSSPYWSTTITSANIPASVTYNSVSYSVTSIGDYAFNLCTGLTSITIPDSVTSIGEYAFGQCTGLTSVTIPNSVTSIGYYAFDRCTGLTALDVATDNPYYCSEDGVLFNKDKTTLIRYPGGKQGAYAMPNSVTDFGVAFAYCSGLTSIEISNSVTSIFDYAFPGCISLTSVTIPNSVSVLLSDAFCDCSSLTALDVATDNPDFCSEDGVLFNKDKTALILYPRGKQGAAYAIPNSVTSIGSNAFYYCSGLTSVTIPNSVTSIGNNAFYYCSGLTSLEIPNSVTSIEERAFSGCTGLTSVTIPNSVTRIGYRAFSGCSGLTSVTIEAETPPVLSHYVFDDTNNCPINVPCNAVNTYKTAAQWKSYADRIYVNPDCPNITVRLDPSSCSGWSTVRLWAWTDAGDVFDSWPGQIVSTDDYGWYSYTFDASITSVSIIWTNGTDKTIDIRGVTSSTCYALNSTTGTTITARVVDCVTGQTLGHADETTTTDVTATPNEDYSVTLTWPAVNGADTYTIEIKKNGVSVCTLVFKANGQLISINFAAPARDGKGRNVPAAEQSANGWTYVVTGLEGNASYTYSVTAKDVNGNVLLKQSVDFSTGVAQGIEDVQGNNVQCTKVVRNGQIFILRGDKTYTVTGQEVK